MIKRPNRNETEEEILRLQEEFFQQKSYNPYIQPAARVVKIEKGTFDLQSLSKHVC